MSKILKSYRLKKRDVEYLKTLASKNNFNSETEVLNEIIRYYRIDRGLDIESNQKITTYIHYIYSSLVPFAFGSIFAYFFIMRRYIFIPFLVIAILPFLFKLEVKNENTLRVGI